MCSKFFFNVPKIDPSFTLFPISSQKILKKDRNSWEKRQFCFYLNDLIFFEILRNHLHILSGCFFPNFRDWNVSGTEEEEVSVWRQKWKPIFLGEISAFCKMNLLSLEWKVLKKWGKIDKMWSLNEDLRRKVKYWFVNLKYKGNLNKVTRIIKGWKKLYEF